MKKVALVIPTHNGTEKLDRISKWIETQLPWRGPLIVIASGSNEVSSLKKICEDQDIEFIYQEFLICGHAKRNFGAEIALGLGVEYVTFLNDYQRLEKGALHGFTIEDHDEDIVYGNVGLNVISGVTRPRISELNTPLTRNSSSREIWGIFSSVSEAGILVKIETFARLKGWQSPVLKNRTFIGGDGLYLTARVFSQGGTFGYSNMYVVSGGHKNLEATPEMDQSKAAIYPYGFTLATKHKGVPRWISLRFIIGRIGRILENLMRLKFKEAFAPIVIFDTGSRLRAYFSLKPSKHSKLLDDLFDNNCKSSENYCIKNGATKCNFYEALPKL